jgi:hypothetical protein
MLIGEAVESLEAAWGGVFRDWYGIYVDRENTNPAKPGLGATYNEVHA